jgi:parallel beta-helix repeat protein
VESNDVKEKYVPVWQPIPKRPPDGLNLPRLMWTICKRWNDEFLEKKRIVLKETERLLTHKAYTHARTNYTIVIEDSFERFIFQQTIEWLGRGELLNRIFSGIMLTLLLTSMLPSAFIILPVKAAGGTVYIRADGSIDPPTANITSGDNVTYYFTGNNYDEIVVERNNIIIDGNGYMLQGTQAYDSKGIYLNGMSNVTVKNTIIRGFYYGVYLNSTSYCVLSRNNITNNGNHGIRLGYSSFNNVSGNKLTNNDDGGIWLEYSSNNSVFNNNLISNTNGGIGLSYCSSNNISGNDIRNNIYMLALWLWKSFGNIISGNNIVANYGGGIRLDSSSNNTLRTNNMIWNLDNFGVSGEALSDFVNDVDDSNTVDGKPIYYWVSKQDSVVPLNAGYVALVNCTRITVQNLNLTVKTTQGILLAFTTNSTITKNNITNSFIGADLRQSLNNSIVENNITNTGYGVYVISSSKNIISGNNITNSEHGGILIDESSNNNSIVGNNIVVSGSNGIYLGHFSNNNIVSRNNIANHSYYGGITFWDSSNNIITENSITNNKYSGISLSNSSGNIFYHNNFVNNTRQVYEWSQEYPEISPSINVWDNSYPSGGNYWSNYTGVDMKSGFYQNETGNDGIGDMTHTIDANNTDHYPLMAPISFFNAGTWNDMTYYVHIVSNSTISDFYFNPGEGAFLRFNVTGEEGIEGFCRVTIPKDLLWVEDGWTIFVGEESVNYTIIPDNDYAYLYFTYNHSTQTVIIQGTHVIPEFPQATILPLFMIFILVVSMFRKKREMKHPKCGG